jgi:tRNA-specific 2-thiouridylase
MNEPRRVAVAMSGGVDSSVAAALLRERGHSVLGVTMRLWREAPLPGERDEPSGVDDCVEQAAAVCRRLGIPHHAVDLRDAFERVVVDYLVAEYARGRTPNPCLQCNRAFKFGALLRHAHSLGASHLATGHYARVERRADAWRLLTAVDARKDQSYVLYALRQAELAALMLPLGALTKERVRGMARAMGLPAAERAESQDICFLRDGNYRRFIAERAPGSVRPGPILHLDGRPLGEHRGLPFYTVGQREGLGIAAPHPLYVLRIDAARNALIVGPAESLGRDALLAEAMSYVAGASPPEGTAVEAKIRYRARRVAARIWPLSGERARVTLERPLRDITPGQAVVLYDGQEVLGGGIIVEALQQSHDAQEGALHA